MVFYVIFIPKTIVYFLIAVKQPQYSYPEVPRHVHVLAMNKQPPGIYADRKRKRERIWLSMKRFSILQDEWQQTKIVFFPP